MIGTGKSPARRAKTWLTRIVTAVVLLIASVVVPPALAQVASDAPEQIPPNVETLLGLLADPGVQAWLHAHKLPDPGAHAVAPEAHATRQSHLFADYVASIRTHIYGLAAAMKDLPGQFERAGHLVVVDVEESGPLGLMALIAILIAACLASRFLYRKATRGLVRLPDGSALTTWDKLSIKTKRFLLDLGEVAAIGLAGTVAFLALDYWPDIIERIILAFLLASICWLTIRATGRYFLEAWQDFRLLPVNELEAGFWLRQIDFIGALLTFGSAAVLSICLLGFSDEACEVLSYALGLVALAVTIYSLHARIPSVAEAPANAAQRQYNPLFISLTLVLLWCFWALGATPVFLLGSVLLGAVCAIKLTRACVDHCFGDPDDSLVVVGNAKLTAILIERTIRFVLILLALALAVWAWDVDFVALDSVDSRIGRLVHGLILAGIILLAANFAWSMLRTVIDQQIAKVRGGASDPQQANRFATLLPVLRNFLWAAIVAFAILMALSELGVEVAPLIAGAGVAGVAIGFGAQTLVKDIISGIFYLVDDAFRVGEYIESGSYKGTVESFSLRSVRLRHNRGPIFTVPFGVLGAVQNMSRDWVIEKLRLTITYDSDVEKARKIIKRIGLELAEEPELKLVTLEPLKMQGVEDFGDYGVVLTLKLKTKPGQQFVVRRRAMVLIKREFEANGIRFASPSVQVTGTSNSTPEEARQAVAAHSLVTPTVKTSSLSTA